MNRLLGAVVVLYITVAMSAPPTDPVSLSRYALIIGSNTGNEDRAELKYAISDAEAFARVLTEMGGVRDRQCIMVKNPDKTQLLRNISQLKQMIATDKLNTGRKEVVVYYSGHADEKGIILGNERFTYGEMRTSLHDIGVDVRIAFLDACASGSLTREKGGKHRQPFLYDVSTSMEGYAYITSSSSDEASQESDAIQSSFFTHYLVSGMRGPADANLDGKVTLNEAYEFAYDETLRRTEKTKAGPQHATYDIRLKGSGDLVLTDLRTCGSVLRILPEVNGRIFVHDPRGHLLVELYKNPGKKLEIGLEPGNFEIIVHTPATVSAGKVTLSEGRVTEVGAAEFTKVTPMQTWLRGNSGKAADGYRYIPVNVSLTPRLSISSPYPKTIANGGISLLCGETDRLYGVDLALGISMISENAIGLQLAGLATRSGNISGIQMSTLFNSAKKTTGIQMAAGMNCADTCTGIQFALLNRCGVMTGIQFGVIAISDTVIGMPFALFSYVRKTPPRYRIYVDEAGFFGAGIRTGGDHFYSLLSLGTSTIAETYQWYFSYGMGARLLLGRSSLALESMAHGVLGTTFRNAPPILHVRCAAIYSYQVTPGFSLWAGPSLNFGATWNTDKKRSAYTDIHYQHHLNHWHGYWPGVLAGVELSGFKRQDR